MRLEDDIQKLMARTASYSLYGPQGKLVLTFNQRNFTDEEWLRLCGTVMRWKLAAHAEAEGAS